MPQVGRRRRRPPPQCHRQDPAPRAARSLLGRTGTEPLMATFRPGGRRTNLDPRARAMLAWLDLAGWPSLAERTPAQARRDVRILAALTSGVEPVARVEERRISGPGGPLTLRIYAPRAGRRPRPVLVW